MQDRIFYATCFGFLAGVLMRSFVSVGFYAVALGSVLSLALVVTSSIARDNRRGIQISVFLLALSLGILRFHVADVPPPQIFESQVGTSVLLLGTIADEPTITDKNQRLVAEVRVGRETAKIIISSGFEEEYRYGDEISFKGKLQKPENFLTDQGKVFDYARYLRKDGILYVMHYPEIEIISRDNGNLFKRILFRIKQAFLQAIHRAIPAPENLLMGGLILGERAAFDDDLRQDLVDTGTIHIVALSGYNVTIVAEWIMKLLLFLPRSFAFATGICSILLFVIMAGAASTAVRAGIMGSLALVARATGRNYDAARALILTAVAMIFFNPFVLAYDVSFQLSFLATIAVIFFAPKIEKYFSWVTASFGMRGIVSVTTAVYIFVLPFILYRMGSISFVALPANFLILPFIPATMGLGFFTGVAGFLWYGLAAPFGLVSYLFLHYELGVIRFLADVPFASVAFSGFPLWLAIAIYIGLAYLLFRGNFEYLYGQES